MPSPDDFPKILVATSFPPSVPGGSPWVFDQLRRGIAPEKLSWWACGGTPPAACNVPLSQFKSGNQPPRLQPHIRFTQTKCFLLEQIWVPAAARGLRAFIRQQKPDLLWLLPYAWAAPVLHRAVQGLGIPWHITVHDLADTAWSVRSLGLKRAHRFQHMIDELYAGAVSRDVYMQELVVEMERTTGRKADAVIRCGVEPEELEYVRTKPFPAPADKIRIGYPGTVVCEDTFARFIAALQLLKGQLPLPVEVNLFGPHSYRNRPWFDESLILEHGYLPEQELDRLYNRCSWGLAIMNLDDSNPRYSRFTFPCKFTRGLAAGIPLICIGHPESTLARLAKTYELGPVLTTSDPGEMAKGLAPALSAPGDPSRLRSEMLRCAETEFNAERNRQVMHAIFRASAAKRVMA